MPPMDSLIKSSLNAAALRPDSDQRGTVAEAFEAQDLLRSAVQWHQKHEGEVLPTPLLSILVAARRVC